MRLFYYTIFAPLLQLKNVKLFFMNIKIVMQKNLLTITLQCSRLALKRKTQFSFSIERSVSNVDSIQGMG